MRRSPALLPLPFFIALSLPAMADDPPPSFALCPVEDAVPVFDATAAKIAPVADPSQLATDIEGDAVTGVEGQSTTFSGNVALTRGDQFVGADDLTYDSQTEKYRASGNVRYQDSGMRLVADSAEGDQATDSHDVRNVRYQLTERRGNGGADQIQMQGAQGSLYDSTYSTCPPSDRQWELKADRIDIDTDEGTGIARNAVLRVGRIPVLFVPYMPFPIDDRRRTGLLYPKIGLNDRNGFDYAQPIYFNIAPNLDDTLTPRLMTDRGLMLSNEFRYLTPTGAGVLDLSYLPGDRLTDRKRDEELADFIANGYDLDNRRAEDRGRFRFNGYQNLGPRFQARANLNWVSDARFAEDFSSSLNGLSNYAITSDLGVYGHGRYWNASLMADHWQLTDYTLRDFNLPYDRLPRLAASWEQPFATWFTAGVQTEAVNFQHIDDTSLSLTQAGGSLLASEQRPDGSRFDVKPFVSFPLEGASWFIRPTLAWRYTGYRLSDELANRIAYDRAFVASGNALPAPALVDSLRDDAPSRSVPIGSFDAGVYFDRDAEIGGTSFLHTLEPRMFYLNVPYENQDDLPLFDTQPLTFSYGQLFRDNRFSGADRQADANQLTLALTSRLVRQSDGREKLTASIGQIRYFDDSRVGLSPVDPGVERGRSAWIADGNYAINDRWSVGASYQYDPQFRRKDLASFRTRYLLGDEGIVNLGYRYRRNAVDGNDLLEQVDLSFLYPISPSWSLVGRYYYSLLDDASRDIEPQLLEGIFGVQWDSCCIAARVVARRYVRNRTGELNDALQFEIELKGLGTAGQDTTGRLRRSILGYNREDLYLVPPAEVRTGGDDADNPLQDPTTL